MSSINDFGQFIECSKLSYGDKFNVSPLIYDKFNKVATDNEIIDIMKSILYLENYERDDVFSETIMRITTNGTGNIELIKVVLEL